MRWNVSFFDSYRVSQDGSLAFRMELDVTPDKGHERCILNASGMYTALGEVQFVRTEWLRAKLAACCDNPDEVIASLERTVHSMLRSRLKRPA